MNELLNPTTCVFIKEKQTEIIGKDILTQENDMKQEVETSIMKLPAKNSKDFLLLSEAVRKKKTKKLETNSPPKPLVGLWPMDTFCLDFSALECEGRHLLY